MILASTAKGSNLQEFPEIADGVMEVILPFIAMAATPQTTELGELKAEVASLKRQLSNLHVAGQCRSKRRRNRRTRSHSPSESGVFWFYI